MDNEGFYIYQEKEDLKDCFPAKKEIVCIQVPKIFDQILKKEHTTKNVILKPCGEGQPCFELISICDFNIVKIKVLSKKENKNNPDFKTLKLLIKMKYTIHYSDRCQQLSQCEIVEFCIEVKDFYCPASPTQMGMIRMPKSICCTPCTKDCDGLLINVESRTEAYNEYLNPCVGVLTFNIRSSIVIRSESIVQLRIPSYGNCPVPKEQ